MCECGCRTTAIFSACFRCTRFRSIGWPTPERAAGATRRTSVRRFFLELVSRNPTFPTENARRAWLIRVTVNKSNSLWRTLWRRRVELREKVEVAAAQSDEASALADALAALSEDDRMLIHLFYYEGLKSGEIAGVLKRRPDAVRKQLSRARARMKRILSGEGFE